MTSKLPTAYEELQRVHSYNSEQKIDDQVTAVFIPCDDCRYFTMPPAKFLTACKRLRFGDLNRGFVSGLLVVISNEWWYSWEHDSESADGYWACHKIPVMKTKPLLNPDIALLLNDQHRTPTAPIYLDDKPIFDKEYSYIAYGVWKETPAGIVIERYLFPEEGEYRHKYFKDLRDVYSSEI